MPAGADLQHLVAAYVQVIEAPGGASQREIDIAYRAMVISAAAGL